MWLNLFRAFTLGLLTYAGYMYTPFQKQPLAGALFGLILGFGVIALEAKLRAVPGPHVVGALVGGVTGLLAARLIWSTLEGLDVIGVHFVHVFLVVFLGYMGIVIGGQKSEWFEPARIIAAFRDSSRLHQYKLLDTSVVIDGRVLQEVGVGS